MATTTAITATPSKTHVTGRTWLRVLIPVQPSTTAGRTYPPPEQRSAEVPQRPGPRDLRPEAVPPDVASGSHLLRERPGAGRPEQASLPGAPLASPDALL